jgi:oxalate decarboxylase/phosphoglucose isomerase-like protein (cupin superfamily)
VQFFNSYDLNTSWFLSAGAQYQRNLELAISRRYLGMLGGGNTWRKGEKLKARRVTGSSVFHVVRGSGRTVIDGKPFDWSKGDIIALPSWAQHAHSNTGSEDAILFSISDRPVIQALGLYREDLSAV